MNPLKTVNGAILTGLLLMAALGFALGGSGFSVQNLDRWLHIISGVAWIGLLYYFNVVQIPGLAAAGTDKGGPGGAGISKYIAPRALLWFRWAAVVTALSGVLLIEFAFRPLGGGLMQVLALQEGFRVIGVGSWLGLIMLFNVWVLIWPNQKKVLGITPATDEQKAAARNVALLASRTNFVLSLPMLMCMTGQSHGLPF
ncbi:MAG: urate hydroxylase PuuD [Gammaproteobacteria bacterium]|nr:urate hydroxylase PuuD [Gammaproteobacteria bacterium]